MAAVSKKTSSASGAPKLYTYLYECTNTQGAKVNGQVMSPNLAAAKMGLRRQGLNPIKVSKKSGSLFALRKPKITVANISEFSRQMATMMTAGIPLVQSFDIVAKGCENTAMRNLVLNIKSEIESGRSFSEALTQYPAYFDSLFCNLVNAGETSGSLETMLDRIATYKEKTESLKRKIKKALFYPCAVTVIAIIVTGILLIFVVPQFEKLFKGFGADLPWFTLMVIHLSNAVQKWWLLILAVLFSGSWIFVKIKQRSIALQEALDRLMLRIPIIGSILKKAAIARFARTLATTFAAGVPLVDALNSVAGATGNSVFSKAVLKIKEEVSTGSQVQAAMRNTNAFPPMVVQMVAIGEESGAIDAMLSKVATIYEEEVDMAVDGLSSLLEPIIMAFLGIVVGGLVIAMYLPIFKMGSIV